MICAWSRLSLERLEQPLGDRLVENIREALTQRLVEARIQSRRMVARPMYGLVALPFHVRRSFVTRWSQNPNEQARWLFRFFMVSRGALDDRAERAH
jgi:hypothetical protein